VKVSILRKALLVTVLLPWMAGCEKVTVTAVDVAQVVVSPTTVQLPPGEQQQLSVDLRDSNGRVLTGRQISWTSGDSRVATVDASGLVLAVDAGTTEISVAAEGVSSSVPITVDRTGEIRLSASKVDLQVRQGLNTQPVVLAISNAGAGTLTGLSLLPVDYSAGGTGWLSVQLSGSTAPAQLTVAVVASVAETLAPGIYLATVLVTAPNAANGPLSIPVELTISPPEPAIGVNPGSVAFAITQGDVSSDPRVVSVTNIGGDQLSSLVEIILYDQVPTGWLSAALSSSTAPATLTLTLNPTVGTYGTGVHTARVRIQSPLAVNAPVDVLVTLTVGEPPPVLSLSNLMVDFVAVVGDSAPALKTVQLTNRGGGSLDSLYHSVRWDDGAPNWVTMSLSSESAPSELTLTPVTMAFPAGIYSATVTVGSPLAVNPPQEIAVNLVVQTQAVLNLSTTAISFTGNQNGADPLQQAVSVTNGGEASLAGITATVVNYVGGQDGWLSATLDSTTAATTLRLNAAVGTRTPGTLTAQVIVASPDASTGPDTIDVAFEVLLSGPAQPTAMVFSNETTTSIDVGFTDNANNEAGFVVQMSTGGGSWATIANPGVAAATGTTVTVSSGGLLSGQTYSFRAWAQNLAGTSDTLTASRATQPLAPGIDSVTTSSPTQAVVFWSPNNGDGVTYDIQRSPNGTTSWATVSSRTASDTGPFTHTPIADGTTHFYRVVATSVSGAATSATGSVTTLLAAPTSLAGVSNAAGTEVALTWADNSASETGYEVSRNGSVVDTTAADVTGYTVTGLTPGLSSTYQVCAVKATFAPVCATVAVTTTGADLAVTVGVSPPSISAGGSVTFTLMVTNNGPSAATAIVVSVVRAVGLGIGVPTVGQGSYTDAASGDWIVGSLANGASATLTILYNPAVAGSYDVNVTGVTANESDTNAGNNTNSATVTVS